MLLSICLESQLTQSSDRHTGISEDHLVSSEQYNEPFTRVIGQQQPSVIQMPPVQSFGTVTGDPSRAPQMTFRRRREEEGEALDPQQLAGEAGQAAPLQKRRRTEAEKEVIREEQAKQLAAVQLKKRAEAGHPLPALESGV